jgi:hypothetical protein
MGYTKIIGTPVITGLYTLFLPVLMFALFGSSRHLVVAADSASAGHSSTIPTPWLSQLTPVTYASGSDEPWVMGNTRLMSSRFLASTSKKRRTLSEESLTRRISTDTYSINPPDGALRDLVMRRLDKANAAADSSLA